MGTEENICTKWKWHRSNFFSSKDERIIIIVSAKGSDNKRDSRDFVSFAVYVSVCFLYIHICIFFFFLTNSTQKYH